MSSLLFSVLTEYFAESLSPLEYDGRALLRAGDKSDLRAALAWEARNAARLADFVADELLRPLQLFLRSSDARDKLGRLVQYALRLLLGLCAALPFAKAPSALVARLRSLMETISDARRTHRWLKGISPLLALRASARAPAEESSLWSLGVAEQFGLLAYTTLDHWRWCQQHGAAPGGGDYRATARRAMRWLAAAHAAKIVHLLVVGGRTPAGRARLRELRAAALRLGVDAHAALRDAWPAAALPALQRRAAAWQAELALAHADAEAGFCFIGGAGGGKGELALYARCVDEVRRQLMLLAQAAHIGKLFETHDALIGALGVATSATDLWRIGWPRIKSD